MLTKQDFADILEKHSASYLIVHFDNRGYSRDICILLGNQLVTLNMLAAAKIMWIGESAIKCFNLTWDDWFRFDETDIEYRGIDLEWWKEHKPVLQELVQLIESQTSKTEPVSKPANCRPDICPQ